MTKGFSVSANYVTIDGFEIANTSYSAWNYSNGAGIYNTGSNNIFQNNYIHDVSLDGMLLAAQTILFGTIDYFKMNWPVSKFMEKTT